MSCSPSVILQKDVFAMPRWAIIAVGGIAATVGCIAPNNAESSRAAQPLNGVRAISYNGTVRNQTAVGLSGKVPFGNSIKGNVFSSTTLRFGGEAFSSKSEFDACIDDLLLDIRETILHLRQIGSCSSAVLTALEDAIIVAQAWPSDLPLPVFDFDDEDTIVLDVIGENGLAVAGLDFSGINHETSYSIIDGQRILSSGSLNTTSTTDLISFFKSFRGFLEGV